MTNKFASNWLVPAFLLMLGALNIASGAYQLNQMAQEPTAESLSGDFVSAHYFEMPVPIVVHIVSGIPGASTGAGEFAFP